MNLKTKYILTVRNRECYQGLPLNKILQSIVQSKINRFHLVQVGKQIIILNSIFFSYCSTKSKERWNQSSMGYLRVLVL
jgi:hypothetical protein